MVPSYDQLSVFAAVCERGSFRAASSTLGVSASAVSHAIAKLEQKLGARLFLRTTRATRLTDAGTSFWKSIGPALKEIASACETLGHLRETPNGLVRITAPRLAAATVLAEFLPKFLLAYPDIEVDLKVEDGFEDFVASGFDAGVRFGEALKPDVVAIRFGDRFSMVVAGSPDYFARHKAPVVPEELQNHNCIQIRLRSTARLYVWEFERDGRTFSVETQGQFIVDDQEAAILGALAGTGLVYSTASYVSEHLQRGTLVRALEPWTPATEQFFLYYSRTPLQTAPLQAFISAVRNLAPRPELLKKPSNEIQQGLSLGRAGEEFQ